MCQMHSEDPFPWDQKDNKSTKSSRQQAFKDSEGNQNALREVHTEISQNYMVSQKMLHSDLVLLASSAA